MNNPFAWLLWFIINLIFLLSTRNPIYLVCALIGLVSLGWWISKKDNRRDWLKRNLQSLFIIILFSSLINSLFTHNGQTILFTIPGSWPLIGGMITLESLVYGAINGLIIGNILILFTVLNLALSIKQLTRLIPRAFYPIGMIVSIAMTFFPSIQRRFGEIKEAQMIRGNPMKKIADWLPILVPLLVSSLENGLILSESMTSRGFFTTKQEKNSVLPVIALIIGTFSIFSGWILAIYAYPRNVFFPLFLVGGIIIFITLWQLGHSVKTTRYHKRNFRKPDIIAIVIMLLMVVIFIFFSATKRLSSLTYSPYPAISAPTIEIIPILLSSITLLPIVFIKNDQN